MQELFRDGAAIEAAGGATAASGDQSCASIVCGTKFGGEARNFGIVTQPVQAQFDCARLSQGLLKPPRHEAGVGRGNDGTDFIVTKHWDWPSYLFFDVFGMGRRSGPYNYSSQKIADLARDGC
jgi:hypothetical protein